ncbi:MAG: hypothetical protein HDS79_01530 [Bacteroidales bacterium]|nr:hypothetical protein [Bacteroidales bacterium]
MHTNELRANGGLEDALPARSSSLCKPRRGLRRLMPAGAELVAVQAPEGIEAANACRREARWCASPGGD